MQRRYDDKSRYFNWPALLSTVALTLVLFAGDANAADWNFSFTPYMWATNIHVDAKLDGRQVVDKEIPVSDLMKDLNTIFQGRFETQHGRWGAMADFFGVSLTDEVSGIALPSGAGQATLKSDIGMTLIDVAGTYHLKQDRQAVTFLYGTRLLNNRATVDAKFNLANGQTVPQSYTTEEWLVDGFLGARYDKRFSRRWSFQAQGDVSTGETNYTWSVAPTVGYSFGKPGRYTVNAGYRHMVIDFKENNGLESQMTMSGPLVSFRFSF